MNDAALRLPLRPALLAAVVAMAAGELFAADPLLESGCLDVTKTPYRADPTGTADSTEAIQRAANDARDRGLACFFPEGTYVVSDTISCQQQVSKLATPRHVDGGTQHYWPVQRPNAGDANTPCRITSSRDVRVYCMYGNVVGLQNIPMLELIDSEVAVCQLKAFRPGDFPHIRETWNHATTEISSSRVCARIVRESPGGEQLSAVSRQLSGHRSQVTDQTIVG